MTNQPFYTVLEQHGNAPSEVEGILGIGTKFSEEYSLLTSFAKQGLIERALVGLALSETGGAVSFGSVDYDINVWAPNASKDSWSVEISDLSIDEIKLMH